MWINVLCTLVEAGGLVLVIVVGLSFWGTVDYRDAGDNRRGRRTAAQASRLTPHMAIAALFLILAPLALLGTIAELAAATVLLLLLVFTVVNAALFVLKRRKGELPGQFEVPLFVPAAGAIVCLVLIVVRVATGDWRAPALAGVLLLGSLGLYALMRRSVRR